MKKAMSILIMAVIVFTMIGCGNSKASNVSDSDSKVAESEKETEKNNLEGELLPMEIVEATTYISSHANDYSDDAYMKFVGIIHNPNTDRAMLFPDLTVTLRNPDNSIVATEDQIGMYIAPGDTITLIGMVSAPESDLSADTQVDYTVECSDVTKNIEDKIKTTDFLVENISERGTDEQYITGEVTNTTEEMVDMACVTLLLRKAGKIVYADDTFVDKLRSGKPVAFEFSRYDGWPEHDDIEISVQDW